LSYIATKREHLKHNICIQ